MKNKIKKEVEEIKEYINQLKDLGLNDASKRSEVIEKLNAIHDQLTDKSFDPNITSGEEMATTSLIHEVEKAIKAVEKKENLIKKWFMKHPRIAIAGGCLGMAAVLGASIFAVSKSREDKIKDEIAEAARDFEEDFDYEKTLRTIEEVGSKLQEEEPISEQETQLEKEEEIVNLVKDLTAKFNDFEGLNVTDEQTLALFIHLNVGNSYMNEENTLALDKLTREDLIKRYYVGLTPGTEEFEEYKISDDDLTKLTSSVMELRNELSNYIIVLNDKGKYEESKQILEILNGFITEKELQDEASVLIDSVKDIQTKDTKEIKKQAYLWYNYLYAGPKSDVRNFDEYGNYKDADGKEMTFENQGMTIRFLTWFLNVFVDTSISGKSIIPQDIINDAQAKLLDQSNLLRALGYKNCSAFTSIYEGLNFDESISNKTGKKSSGKTSTTTSTTATPATGDAKLDAEIDEFLQQEQTVGSSTVTSDGSTVTITQSGPTEATIEVAPPSGSATTEITTPAGPTETTVIEGGGNEQVEEIIFEEDTTNEVIIEQGGEVISGSESTETYTETYTESNASVETYSESSNDAPTESVNESSEPTVEVITFEEDVQDTTGDETASIRDEINNWLAIRDLMTGYSITIEEEKPFEKVYTC